jgi:multiple sugar transport system substrate-binding protein
MDMKDNGIIFPGEMTMKEDLALLQFAEGNVGMMFIQNWGPVLLEDLFSINCDWGVAMPPAINKDVKEKGYVGIDLSGWQVINKKTKNLKKSVAFWKYLYSKDYNSKLYQDGCLLPVIDGIITDTNNQPDLKNFGQFIPGSKDSVYPLTPLDIDEVNRANIYRSIFDDLSPLESGLSNESARLNMLLDKYQIMGKVNINDYVNPAISHELP